jgi:hypothetical protein
VCGCQSLISTIPATRTGERGRTPMPSPAVIISRRVPKSIPSNAILCVNCASKHAFSKIVVSVLLGLRERNVSEPYGSPGRERMCLRQYDDKLLLVQRSPANTGGSNIPGTDRQRSILPSLSCPSKAWAERRYLGSTQDLQIAVNGNFGALARSRDPTTEMRS